MNDIVKDREMEQNKHRVALNLLVLLDIGLFPGKHALGLEECKGFVKAIMEDAAARLNSTVPAPVAAPSKPTQEPHGDPAVVPPDPAPAAA